MSLWSHPPAGGVRDRFRNLFTTLRDGKDCVHVVAYGGSVTAGHGCRGGAHYDRNCSWPARVVRLLRGAYPLSCVTEENRAVGGATSASALSQLSRNVREFGGAPTLILVDFSVNDVKESINDHRKVGAVVAAAEAWMRLLLQSGPHLVPLLVESFPDSSGCLTHKTTRGDAARSAGPPGPYYALKEALAAHYGLPAVFYYRLVPWWCPCKGEVARVAAAKAVKDGNAPWWNSFSLLKRRPYPLNTEYKNYIHPLGATHQLIAEAVAGALDNWTALPEVKRLKQSVFYTWLPPPLFDNQFAVCNPISTFDSGLTAGVRSDGNWSYFEDATGKPGYITIGPLGAQIQFDLRFGTPVGFFRIVYLRGYDINGSVDLDLVHTVDAAQRHRVVHWGTLHARRGDDELVSQAAVFTGVTDVKRHTIPRNTTATLIMTLRSGNKFKIISVASCAY